MNWDDATFTDPQKAISIEDARKAFESKLGIELSYNLITDYTAKTETPILAYSFKNGSLPIDAITGEVLANSYNNYFGSADMAAKSAATIGSAAQIKSPEEQKAVDSSTKYISKDDAIAEAKKYISIDDTQKASYASLNVNEIDKSANWNFSWNKNDTEKQTYSYSSASINAITGKMVSFSMDGNEFVPDKDAKISYTTEQAVTIAQKFINSIEPDKFKLTVSKDNINTNYNQGSKITNYNFSYVGKINDAICNFDNFYINVNAYTGKVMNYSMNWKDIAPPVVDKVISLDKAYTNLYSKAKFKLQYVRNYDYSTSMNGVQTIKLAYVLDGFSGMLDANTGNNLDGNGKLVIETTPINYSDIKGNSAENDINILVGMGIITDNAKTFNPDGKILQKDFIKMLMISQSTGYYATSVEASSDNNDYDTYYDAAIQKNIISASDKKPDEAITRQEAAKMIIRSMGMGYIGEVNSMFNLQFKDAASIPDNYKGYAELVAGLNILQPIDENFNGTTNMTRGQSASMIVNYLKVDTSK